MKCAIGLGSNLGDRRANLERAVQSLARVAKVLRTSVIYETPALVLDGSPKEWKLPFLNAVVEIDWTEGSAHDLLRSLKSIEREMGRGEWPRWAPRNIDLDILLYGDENFAEPGLRVPHPEVLNRSFTIEPLKDLRACSQVPGSEKSLLQHARGLAYRAPWIMAILNLTPDSFSDGGEADSPAVAKEKIIAMESSGVHAIDIGAESTRPGATLLTVEEEMERLQPVLAFLRERYTGKFFRPYLSVDTRHVQTAALALESGFNCINDVTGRLDPAMLELLRASTCDYVLMHSLTVPADRDRTLPEGCDPIAELRSWLNGKLKLLETSGIDLSRIIFDPGIGFGKTSRQSLEILKRIGEFADLPVRLLVGHSRKSFMKELQIENRDAATLVLSLRLARQGVDILRVHDFSSHMSAFKMEMEYSP